MYKDLAPHLPKVIILEPPEGLLKFQQAIDSLEILGIEIDTATADILDHFRSRDDGIFNLAASGYDMLNEHQNVEFTDDVQRYVEARDKYGNSLFDRLIQNGMFVNGVLFYQLRRLNKSMLMLEKLQVPLTDDELKRRHIARQADTASRRLLSATHARAPWTRWG